MDKKNRFTYIEDLINMEKMMWFIGKYDQFVDNRFKKGHFGFIGFYHKIS